MHILGHPKPFTRYRTLPTSQKAPLCSFLVSLCALPPSNATTVLIFFHHRLSLLVPELHIYRTKQFTLLYGLVFLSILILKFIYLCILVVCYFLLLSSMFMHLPIRIHGCFQFLVLKNKGVMNIRIRGFLQTRFTFSWVQEQNCCVLGLMYD